MFFDFLCLPLFLRKSRCWILGVSLFLSPFVASAQSDIAATRIDATAYQRVVDENLELRKDQARVETEMAELRRKNASLLLDVQDVERKKEQLAVLVSQLKTPAETQTELARLQSEKLVLIREIERLRRTVDVSVPPPTNTAPVAVTAGSDLFRKLERENADLRLELSKAREATLNESVARDLLSKSDSSQKVLVAQLGDQCKKTAVDLENTRLREAAMKKALEVQAKKAFESEAARQKAEAAVVKVKADLEAEQRKVTELKSQKSSDRTLKPEAGNQVVGHVASNDKKDVEKVKAVTPVSDTKTVAVMMAEAQGKLAKREFGDAEKLYRKALKVEPENARVCYNLGVLYGDYLKDYWKASKYYRRYIELAPQAPDVNAVRFWLSEMESKTDWGDAVRSWLTDW